MAPLRWAAHWWPQLRRHRGSGEHTSSAESASHSATVTTFEMEPDDPLLAILIQAESVVDVAALSLDSPALAAMQAAEMELAIPLISQGALAGVIVLGPRASDEQYTGDDRRLLGELGTQTAPALRVAQMARQQQIQARERERIEQELRIARLIQQTLLPREVPHVDGWSVAAHYAPARAVGGDFYDFYYFDDGKIGLVIGDVTDKGVPAALVMATTRAILRGLSQHARQPGRVLQQANEILCPDMPSKMFVTCFCACFDPRTGELCFANAGHDIPYRRTRNGVKELRATGMPLGLLPGMHYEEYTARIEPGETIIFYSDGLVEAHAPDGDMFGFPRVQELMAEYEDETTLIPFLLDALAAFTGDGWEQEDDVTLVTLTHHSDVQELPTTGAGMEVNA